MAEGRAQVTRFIDWSPVLDGPGTAGDWHDHDDLDEHAAHRLLAHAAGLGHQHNGMPDVLPYRWRRGDAQRDQEVSGRLAAIRRVAEQRALARMAHGTPRRDGRPVMGERPLTKRQETTLLMMPAVYCWTQGSLPSLLRRGLVERSRVIEDGRARWHWRLTADGADVAHALRVAARHAEMPRDA